MVYLPYLSLRTLDSGPRTYQTYMFYMYIHTYIRYMYQFQAAGAKLLIYACTPSSRQVGKGSVILLAASSLVVQLSIGWKH